MVSKEVPVAFVQRKNMDDVCETGTLASILIFLVFVILIVLLPKAHGSGPIKASAMQAATAGSRTIDQESFELVDVVATNWGRVNHNSPNNTVQGSNNASSRDGLGIVTSRSAGALHNDFTIRESASIQNASARRRTAHANEPDTVSRPAFFNSVPGIGSALAGRDCMDV